MPEAREHIVVDRRKLDQLTRDVAEAERLLWEARGYIVRKFAHDPDMPDLVDEIDGFMDGKEIAHA